jgi:hypothetical protein
MTAPDNVTGKLSTPAKPLNRDVHTIRGVTLTLAGFLPAARNKDRLACWLLFFYGVAASRAARLFCWRLDGAVN